MRIQTGAFTAKVGSFLMGLSWWESDFMLGNQRCLFACWNISWKHDVIYTEKTRENSPTAMLSLISFSMLTSFVQSYCDVLTSLFQKNCLKRFLLPGENFLAFIYSSANSRVGNWCCRRKRWSSPISYLYYGAHLLRPIIGLVFWFAFP